MLSQGQAGGKENGAGRSSDSRNLAQFVALRPGKGAGYDSVAETVLAKVRTSLLVHMCGPLAGLNG